VTCRTCQQIRDVAWRVARFMPVGRNDSNLRAMRQLEQQRKRELTLDEQRVMDAALRRSAKPFNARGIIWADDSKRTGKR
jgi:uncharacterized protein YebE (UPF0316 family)